MSTEPSFLYLDHAATTPVRPEVVRAMVSCLEGRYGNPSSSHRLGREARRTLEDARDRVASSIGVGSREVYFVRGGTEGDNLAVLGLARKEAAEGRTPWVVTTAVEHPAVVEAAEQVVAEGGRHDIVPFSGGQLDLGHLESLLEAGPSLVSCMWVNNEVGLRLPVEEVTTLCRRHGVPVHSDAVQAIGKVRVDLEDVPLDLATLTGHKFYGPRGTGVLVAREPERLAPLCYGGGQERSVRPGTEDVAGAVGFATALELAVEEQPAEERRLEAIRDALERRILAWDPDVRINGQGLPRAPHVLSLGLDGVDADALLATLDQAGVAASGGSACASGSGKPSPTIVGLYGPDDTRASLRLSLGRLTGAEDEDRIVDAVTGACERVRALLS